MKSPIVAFVITLVLAALSACAAPTDVAGRSEQRASTSSALGVGPSSVPYPVKVDGNGIVQKDLNGHAVPFWTGTLVDIMAADAWAQCGAHVTSAAEFATDGYLTYLEGQMDQEICADAISQVPPPSEFGISGCDMTVSPCPSKMKRWAWQRQIASCNVDTSTGLPAVVRFYKNVSVGHTLAASAFSAFTTTPELTGAIAGAQKEVDVAEVNLCMAQRLRENMASADSLFLSAPDLRQLLEVIRERAQIAMTQYALLARTFTNPDDRPGGPAYPTQSFITLMHWSKQSSYAKKALGEMGEDLAASVQLHVDATRELAELLTRSASARIDRAGAPTSNPQSDFGSGSWRQRLLALLYGGNPLRAGSTPSEVDPVGMSSDEVNALEEAVQYSEPWDTAWTEDPASGWNFPNSLPPATPAQRYARTPTSDPQIKQLLALARKADALYLKEVDADFAHTGSFIGDTGILTFRRIDVDASAPQVWALVEAWLRTEDCKKTNPSCTVGVNDPTMPAPDAYARSLLWIKYGIQPAHASTLVSMLVDIAPLLSEGESVKWLLPSAPSAPYEQAGAMHVTGPSRTADAAELSARLPEHQGEIWYRFDPGFNVLPWGNPERAPLYTTVAPLFVPRSFDKFNVPNAQGFDKQQTALKSLGAISALTVVRDLLEDSVASASASLFTQTYLAKVPHALAVIGGAIGERSISIRPATGLQYLHTTCRDFDPSSTEASPCPTIIQTTSADGITARWNVSVRTDIADPFFDTAVSLVFVPFQGGIETAAALDPSYSSLRSTPENPVTRATLLEFTGRIEVPLSAPTTLGTSAVQREATVDLPAKTAISSYFFGARATFSAFLKRTQGGQTEYQLLAQGLGLHTSIQTRAVGDGSTSALIGLPRDGQFIAYGGVLGQMAVRAWLTRADDWSKPAYDGFGLPTDWVPPFDPSLLGAGADDASATYLRNARAAADEATNAVKSAIDELLREQADSATLASAQRKAAGIAQLEQRALCGDAKPDCDTSIVDADLSSYVPVPDCSPGSLCTAAQQLRDRVVPRTVPLAKAVYDHRFAESPPAFNDYAGGALQGVLIEQWAALRKLRQRVQETAAGATSHGLQVAVADAELAQAGAVRVYECRDETMRDAFAAGVSYPVDREHIRPWTSGYQPSPDSSKWQWSKGPLIAQRNACKMARLALDPSLARHAAVVSQAWEWLDSQTTLLLDAGAALQIAGANLAKTLQDTNLAKAQAKLEATLVLDNLETKFGTYRRYHSYDVWRARGLLESTRRYAVAARRAIEARYVVDLSEMRSDEPFVAAPATWADEIYEYDLSAPASVGLTAIPTSGDGIYPNRLVDYVGNLERFVAGYAVARPTAIAQSDDELFHVPGPDVRASGVLSGDVAAWEFHCPNGSWVQHPGLQPTTPNAPIATICGGVSPTRARVSFSLDPWGRLNGSVADAPYTKRHNARWLQLAANVVGTGIRDCAIAADPNGCYANAYLRYNLTHVGPAWVTNFDEQWRSLGVPVGSIEGAKALTAEQWLDPTGNGFSKPYVTSVARTEFAGRPVGGTYRFELEVTPDVRLDRIDRVQVLTRSTYWVKQGQSDPPPPVPPNPPTLTALDYDLADTSGGNSITITGTDLESAASCTVDGAPATITSNTSTSLTFTMPEKSAGMYTVQVATAAGWSNTLQIEAWSPSVLPLTDWQRASYGGSPWLGISSAGPSAGRDLSWTIPPVVGTPVNGLVPASFNGIDQRLNAVATDLLFTSSAYTMFALAKPRTAVPVATPVYVAPAVTAQSGGMGIGLYYDASGFRASHVSGGLPYEVTLPAAVNSWYLVVQKFDGSNIRARLNSAGDYGSIAAGNADIASALLLRVGRSGGSAAFLDMELLELATANSHVLDVDCAKYLRYAGARYKLLDLLTLNSNSFSALGGDTLTVSGPGLGGATATLDGIAVTPAVTNSNTFSFVTPAKAPGTYNLVITAATGATRTLAVQGM